MPCPLFLFLHMPLALIPQKECELMNAVIYARYSGNPQRKESIEGQLRERQQFPNIFLLLTREVVYKE